MKKAWKIGIITAFAASMALAACGGNTSSNNGNNGSNNGSNNGNNGSNNGSTGSNNGSSTGSNNGSNNGNNGSNNMTTMTVPAPPGCDDANPPARCSEDPDGFEWGSASVISKLAVEGESSSDPVCCFDFNNDPDHEIDNALGGILADLGQKQSINDGIQGSIDDGNLVLVLEHDGLADLMNQTDYTINFWLGVHDVDPFDMLDPAGANPVLIDPASIDMGTQPQAYVPMAAVTDGTLTGGPGVVTLQVSILDSPLDLKISQARLEADVDPANSDLSDDTGVALTTGKLGGVVKVEDVYNAINKFAATCTCLGITGDLASYDPSTGASTCQSVDTDTCGDDGASCTCDPMADSTCIQLAKSCNLISAIGLVADVDTDGDGDPDAVSIGASFEAVGATIDGVAATN